MVTAVGLAVGVTALIAPTADAAGSGGQAPINLSPLSLADSLSASSVPASHRAGLPTVTEQLSALKNLGQLNQLTNLAAPVAGLLPGIG
ncbi:hypothetical protein ACFV6E_30580 [Streptomyces sp. NPDC059785]|uniref:hypothetical protein n=1 Tax=Streptomyces sp. NPDC059785 TaxID=3346945 RepID=UPI00365FDC21